MSLVKNDLTFINWPRAKGFATSEINGRFLSWIRQGIPAYAPNGLTKNQLDYQVIYFRLLNAFTNKSDPLASLKETLTKEKDPAKRLKLIVDHTLRLDVALNFYDKSGILRLALYPQIALLIMNDPKLPKKSDNMKLLGLPRPCGSGEKRSVLDFTREKFLNNNLTDPQLSEARGFARAELKGRFSKWIPELPKQIPVSLIDSLRNLGITEKSEVRRQFYQNITYLELLRAIVKGSDPLALLKEMLAKEEDTTKRLKLIEYHACELEEILLGADKQGILGRIIYPLIAQLRRTHTEKLEVVMEICSVETSIKRSVPPKKIQRESKGETLSRLLDTEQLEEAQAIFLAKPAPKKAGSQFNQLVTMLIAREEIHKLWTLRASIYWEKENDQEMDGAAVDNLKSAGALMQCLVSKKPDKWTARACNLWTACLGRYEPMEMQPLAQIFEQITNDDSRINLIKTVLKIDGSDMPKPKRLEWKQLAASLRKNHNLPQLAKHATTVGKKKRRKRKKKKAPITIQTVEVTEVSFKELILKNIPTDGPLRIKDAPANLKDLSKGLQDLLKLCANDPDRRAIALHAILPHIKGKAIGDHFAQVIGCALIQLNDSAFDQVKGSVTQAIASIKDDDLRATLQWRSKRTLGGIVKAITSVKKSSHTALFLSYLEAQLDEGKNEELEKLVDNLLDVRASKEWLIFSIKALSRMGKGHRMEQVLRLWAAASTTVKLQSLASVLQGLIASDNPQHRNGHLIPRLKDPLFKQLEDPGSVCRDLIDGLLKRKDPSAIDLATQTLLTVDKQVNLSEDIYGELAKMIFGAICQIKSTSHRLECTQRLTDAIQSCGVKNSPKQWTLQQIAWLNYKTDLLLFQRILTNLPPVKALGEPLKELHKRLIDSKAPMEHRILVAARLMTMEQQPIEEFSKAWLALLFASIFAEAIRTRPTRDRLPVWTGFVQDYKGPGKEFLLRVENEIEARLIQYEIDDDKSDLSVTTNRMIELLQRPGSFDGQVVLAHNELCDALVTRKPTKGSLKQVKQLLQAAHKSGIFSTRENTLMQLSSNLMIRLSQYEPKLTADLWQIIIEATGLSHYSCLSVAEGWLNKMKKKDAKAICASLLKTAAIAAKTKDDSATRGLSDLLCEMWAKVVVNGCLLTPDQVATFFPMSTSLIHKSGQTVPTVFYQAAKMIAEIFAKTDMNATRKLVTRLQQSVDYKLMPGCRLMLTNVGFRAKESDKHPLCLLKNNVRNGKGATANQLKKYSDQDLMHHFLLPLLADPKPDLKFLGQLVNKRPTVLNHLPKNYCEQEWCPKIYIALTNLLKTSDLGSLMTILNAIEIPPTLTKENLEPLRTLQKAVTLKDKGALEKIQGKLDRLSSLLAKSANQSRQQ